jgi:arylsulfatase A-like enzyme
MNKKEIKNVIVVMADTLQYDYLGCYGNDWIRTPNYDRFALQSTLFENCYADALPTVPCRRSMLTGRYTLPFVGWAPLLPEDTTISDILWGTGVQTALVFDTAPMRLPKYGFNRGFDYVKFSHGQELDTQYFENDQLFGFHPDDFIEERSTKGIDPAIVESLKSELESLLKHRQHWRSDEDSQVATVMKDSMKYLEEEVDRTKPFFLWVDSFDPHEPWDPPSVWDPDMDYLYDPGYKGKDQIVPIPGIIGDRFTEKELHHIRMLYAEKVTLVDKWVGKLLDKIRELGFWDNTLIILTSDHGQPLGNGKYGHGLMRKFRPWPYEEMAHVPCLVRAPGTDEGKRVKSFIQTCDVGPTVLDWLGYMKKSDEAREGFKLKSTLSADDMTGKSILPLTAGESDKIRDFAISGFYGFSWTIVTDDYSYVHWLPNKCESTEEAIKMVYDSGGMDGGEATKDLQNDDMWTCTPHSEIAIPEKDELYDRREDPYQLQNIIGKKPEEAKELLRKLRLFIGELRTL